LKSNRDTVHALYLTIIRKFKTAAFSVSRSATFSCFAKTSLVIELLSYYTGATKSRNKTKTDFLFNNLHRIKASDYILTIERSHVRLPLGHFCNNLGKVVHTMSPNSIMWYRCKTVKVTAGYRKSEVYHP